MKGALEKNDCSRSPFQHCCVGQCRKSNYTIAPENALYKIEQEDLRADILELLDYMEKRKKRIATGSSQRSTSTCKILFAGDSLTSDHVMALNCQLASRGYELTSCNSEQLGGPSYGKDVTYDGCAKKSYILLLIFSLKTMMLKLVKQWWLERFLLMAMKKL